MKTHGGEGSYKPIWKTQKKLVVARGLELEELRKDKIWLKQVVQNLTGDRHDLPH